MRKFFGFILSPLHYIMFGLLLALFQPVQWVCYKFFGYLTHKRVVDFLNGLITANYYTLCSRVTFTNQQSLPLNRPLIFVANHQSLYDIPPLIYFLRAYHAKFISKIELTKGIPSISYNLKVGGGANIDRKDPRQSIQELVKLGTRMKENNWGAVIFPEGTRSKDGLVRSFQSAGIATLLKKCPHALIVPVTIQNSWKVVQWGIFPLSTFEHLKFKVLPPINPSETNAADAVLKAEQAIKADLGQE
ncbi:lysophospholipid acyltransferase family protein [Mucilaginibacter koreensis]